MIRWIARDYITGYRGNGIRKNRIGIILFWISYDLIFLPVIWDCYDTGIGIACYLVLAVPITWSVLASLQSPVRMPKLLFLCPMDKAMRRKYIHSAFVFRLVVHTVSGAIGALVSLLLGNDWLGVLDMVVNLFLLSVLLIDVGTGKTGQEADMSNWGRNTVRAIGAMIVIILLLMDLSAAESGGLLVQAAWEQIIIGCLTVVALLFAGKYVTYWKKMQEGVLCYEDSYPTTGNTGNL